MRIVLVDPPRLTRGRSEGVQVHPLGLGYLAAALAPRHEVWQLVADVRPNTDGANRGREVATAILETGPDLVGVSAATSTFAEARRLIGLLREARGPELPVVLGGVHPTLRPREALGTSGADYVVVGEGEATLRRLADELEAGRPATGIRGLLSGGDDGSCTPRPPVENLDELPFPDRESVLWSEHLQAGFYQSLITSRGCCYQCVYCSTPELSHGRVRYRSPENVVDEIAELRRKHQVPYLFFQDSVFTLRRDRTLRLCRLMVERGLALPYSCQTRTDRVDRRLLEEMRASGCHHVLFGIESGDPETLERIRKVTDLDAIRNAVSEVRRLGMRCGGFFMIGFPWETEAHVRRTEDFATSLELDSISLFSAVPLPGSELFEMVGGCPPESTDFRFPQENYTRLPQEEYVDLFRAVGDRFAAYNRSRIVGLS